MQIRVRDVAQLWIFPLPFEGASRTGAVHLGESVPWAKPKGISVGNIPERHLWFCARDPSLRLKGGSGQNDAPQGRDTQDSDHNARLPSCITSVIASDHRAVKLGGFLL
jgi:hypothetical protein